jgi:tetratricopeptide (TPR) repeat protein
MGKKSRIKKSVIGHAKSEIKGPRTGMYVLICLVLVIITFAPYSRCVQNKFITNYDDDTYVTKNFYIHQGLGQAVSWAFTTFRAANWHPLTWISLALDYQIYGLDPEGYHLTNIILHVMSALLLFLVLGRMTKALWKSGFVAALFAIHPLHVESVAWVSERKDVLSALFWMLTMYAYVFYSEKPRIGRYVLVFIGLALGLMAKPMLVSMPLVLLMLDFWPLKRLSPLPGSRQPASGKRHSVSGLLLEKLPLFALALASCIITFIAQKRGASVGSLELLSISNRIANSVVSYAEYIIKMIWPLRLAVFYPFRSLEAWEVLASTAMLAALSISAILLGRKRRYLLVGWLWYMITLVPVIGLVQVGAQAMADRYTYIPLIGLFIAAVWGTAEIFERDEFRKRAQHGIIGLGVAGCAVILILALCTSQQLKYWKDDNTIFLHAAEVTSHNYVAYTNLSTLAKENGKIQESLDYARKAVEANPRFAPAQVAMANILHVPGVNDINGAVEHYRIALRYDPDNSIAHNNLGTVLIGRNDLAGAEKEFAEALRIDPYYTEAYVNLGVAEARQGNLKKGVGYWEYAEQLSPDTPQIHSNLAVAFFQLGRFADSWKEVELCEKDGGKVDPEIVARLSKIMSRP